MSETINVTLQSYSPLFCLPGDLLDINLLQGQEYYLIIIFPFIVH